MPSLDCILIMVLSKIILVNTIQNTNSTYFYL